MARAKWANHSGTANACNTLVIARPSHRFLILIIAEA